MGQKLPPDQLALYQRIDLILLKDWDPIGIGNEPGARDEYHSYLPHVFRLALEGASVERLKAHLRAVIAEHPDYGYRRLRPDVALRMGEPVNHKRLRRVLRDHDLGLPRCLPKYRPSPVKEVLRQGRGRLDRVKNRGAFAPLVAFSTDITELRYAGGTRKAYLMAFVDLTSKLVPGWALARRADRHLALAAWEAAKAGLHRLGRRPEGVLLHSDQDAIYTSYDWLQQLLVRDRVRVSYSENGCRDNPWIESLWGRMKTEIGSQILEAETFADLEAVLKERFSDYNTRRRHTSIGNMPPLHYLQTMEEATEAVLA